MQQPQKRRFRIGFTGSRKGLTADHQEAVRRQLTELIEEHRDDELEAHHGDAIGADAQFHAACQQLEIPVVIHPSKDHKDRAYCPGAKVTHPPVEFANQSAAIVNLCQILIAAPDGFKERWRGSGTWMTIRAARKAEKTIVLCYPDGVRETKVEE